MNAIQCEKLRRKYGNLEQMKRNKREWCKDDTQESTHIYEHI